MIKDNFELKFWGVRGSVPVSGPKFERFGGNTSCIEMRHKGRHLIFDAGSGLREIAPGLAAEGVSEIDIFFTHVHYDHIIGLPFFDPVYNPRVKLSLWSGHLSSTTNTKQLVSEFMRPPWFPVEPSKCCKALEFHDFSPGDTLTPHDGIVIRTVTLNHPGGCVGYRVEWAGRIVALVYDTEHLPDRTDEFALSLMQDADLVIYDTTYTEDEMEKHRGFGHSTWQEGVRLAEKAGAKRFALFHHAPSRTDDQLDTMQTLARQVFPGAFAAFDGQVVDL